MELYNLDKNKTFLISPKALILENSKLLILKNTLDKYGGISQWELPGGFVEMQEGLEEGLKRETKEETGLDVEIGDLIAAYDRWYSNFKFKDGRALDVRIINLAYICKKISGEIKLSWEHSEFLWVLKEDVAKLDISEDSKIAIEKYFNKHNL